MENKFSEMTYQRLVSQCILIHNPVSSESILHIFPRKNIKRDFFPKTTFSAPPVMSRVTPLFFQNPVLHHLLSSATFAVKQYQGLC